MTRSRGTSNGNSNGSSEDRRRRRAWLVDTFGWRLPDGTGVVCCYRCAVPLLEHDDPEAPGQSVTVDRIVPGVEGGRYVRGNIRPACAGCNSETGGRLARRPGARSRGPHAPSRPPVTRQSRAITGVGVSAGHRLVEQSRVIDHPNPLTGSRVNHGSGHTRRSGAITGQSRQSRTGAITGAPPSLQGAPVSRAT